MASGGVAAGGVATESVAAEGVTEVGEGSGGPVLGERETNEAEAREETEFRRLVRDELREARAAELDGRFMPRRVKRCARKSTGR